MTIAVTWEVVARHFFRAPTIWAFDVTYMLYGTHFMLGTAYTLMRIGHVRTDMLYQNWSVRRQNWIDAIGYLFFFFPAMALFFYYGWQESSHAWSIGETSDASPWRPIVYPFKTVIPVTAFLLIVQGIAEVHEEHLRHPHGPPVGQARNDGDRMSPELLGGIMLALMLVVIFIGFPISFTLLLLALIFGWLGLGDRAFYIMVFQTIGLMKEEVLAAVPLFIFMGYLMEQGGLMERLFRGFQLMMGPMPGSLYVGVLITATIFGIAAGTVGATVVLMGIMAVPIMTKAGYDIRMSAGAITAGGTLGILVPPSVMLVVMGPVMGVSVADLYMSCFGPGFLLAGIFILYCVVRSLINPRLGPPLPPEERTRQHRQIAMELTHGHAAARDPHHRDAGDDHLGLGDAHRGGGHGRGRRRVPRRRLPRVHVAAAQGRGLQHAAPVEHRALPRRRRQRVRRRVLAPGHREGGDRRDDRDAGPAGRDAHPHHGHHLPAGLAVRMAGHHPRLRPAPAAGDRGA